MCAMAKHLLSPCNWRVAGGGLARLGGGQPHLSHFRSRTLLFEKSIPAANASVAELEH